MTTYTIDELGLTKTDVDNAQLTLNRNLADLCRMSDFFLIFANLNSAYLDEDSITEKHVRHIDSHIRNSLTTDEDKIVFLKKKYEEIRGVIQNHFY